eukprot:scaffold570_cov382-Prasinococcus_capsulatus_cf.AAC.9
MQGSFELAVGSFTYSVAWSLLQPEARGSRYFILSEAFVIGGYKWILQFYPYGDTEENSVCAQLMNNCAFGHESHSLLRGPLPRRNMRASFFPC